MKTITESYRSLNRQLLESGVGYGTTSYLRAPMVSALIAVLGAKTVLDYGCGAGTLAPSLKGLAEVAEYDPAVPGKDKFCPAAELVVCTDVLERVEPECLDTVLAQIGYLTGKAAYLVISLVPSRKSLPDGRNAHLIVESADWWLARLAANLIPVQSTVIAEHQIQVLTGSQGISLQKIESDLAVRRGDQLFLAGDMPSAEACFIAAVKADEDNADAWSSLGLIWRHHDIHEDAFKCFHRALAIDPEHGAALTNLGTFYEAQGMLGHAERCYRRAIEVGEHPRARANLGLLCLRTGRFNEGWQLVEARFDTRPQAAIPRDYGPSCPRWDGLPTEKLLVWGEQGIGEQILFGSLLNDLESMGQRYVCEVDERLLPAFRRSFPKGEFRALADQTQPTGVTAHIPMMSLGWFLRSTERSFARQPLTFLRADSRRVNEYYLRLVGASPLRKRVAVSWRSFKPEISRDIRERKSADVSIFAPMVARDDITCVDVQYGSDNPPWLRRIEGLDAFTDIDGVLAVIEACDYVVTTSNVTAHYGGALGKPTFLISKGDPAIFYHNTPHEDGGHLWYPSANVIIQPTWEQCIAKVMEAI